MALAAAFFKTHTTVPEYGPGNWTYIPKPIQLEDSKYVFQGFFAHMSETCTLLTATQRVADWFLLRTFQ